MRLSYTSSFSFVTGHDGTAATARAATEHDPSTTMSTAVAETAAASRSSAADSTADSKADPTAVPVAAASTAAAARLASACNANNTQSGTGPMYTKSQMQAMVAAVTAVSAAGAASAQASHQVLLACTTVMGGGAQVGINKYRLSIRQSAAHTCLSIDVHYAVAKQSVWFTACCISMPLGLDVPHLA